MPAPNHLTIIYETGVDAAPADDVTGPVCGASSGVVIVDEDLNLVIDFPPADVTDETFYGGFHIHNISTGSLQNAKVFNRTACLVNPIVALIGFTTGTGNVGKLVFVWGLVSGLIESEYVTLIDGTAFTTKLYDSLSVKFYECTNSLYQTVKPVEDILVSQSGLTLGLMRGTASNNGKDLSVSQLYSFLRIALGTTKGAPLAFPDRKTDTLDAITAYGQGQRWSGADASLPVQGNVLAADEIVAVACELVLPAFFPSTAYGSLQLNINIFGSAVA